jgi:hypothetical protein
MKELGRSGPEHLHPGHGAAGCGKSTIAAQYAITAANRGGRACIFTFEEACGR